MTEEYIEVLKRLRTKPIIRHLRKNNVVQLIASNDPRLRRVCRDWDFEAEGTPLDDALKMIEIAKRKGGIGLAATQVGLDYRMFVMKFNDKWVTIVNPEITWISDQKITEQEGCLTYPGLFIKINRPKELNVKFFDEAGNEVGARLDGIEARCFQHELEHINGRAFIDGRSTAIAMSRKKTRRA